MTIAMLLANTVRASQQTEFRRGRA